MASPPADPSGLPPADLAPAPKRSQRQWWLIGGLSVIGLCIFACALTLALSIPAARRGLRNEMRDAVSTEIARQIPASAGAPAAPGEYTITEASLQQSIRGNFEGSDPEDTFVNITPEGIQLGVVSRGQDATYSGTPAAEGGQLEMRDMEVNNRFLEFLMPANTLGNAIEKAVNDYLAENNLRLDALDLTDGALVLHTVAAS